MGSQRLWTWLWHWAAKLKNLSVALLNQAKKFERGTAQPNKKPECGTAQPS